MASNGPPVPAKDTPSVNRPKSATPLAMPTSGSKRKRETVELSNMELDNTQYPSMEDMQTPKRSRPNIPEANAKATTDDATPSKKQNLRRKRGMSNLSHASVRHSSSLPPTESPVRESRFQEGSLTDKPSVQPPSIFTRFSRSHSSNPQNVDQLMSDYHNDAMTDQAVPPLAYGRSNSELPSQRDENGNFFRFGRSLAASFHPVALWNRIWNEQKQELARQDMLEAERKALLKAEAEAKYAQMKQNGVFNALATSYVSDVEASPVPRDSGVAIKNDDMRPSHEVVASSRSSFQQMPPPTPDVNMSETGSDIFGSITKPLRSIRSRLHLKRPSLANIKNDLKRVTSDIALDSTASRDSLPPSHPLQQSDLEVLELRKSSSKAELKKASRLSQRVSDLEVKLQRARQELNDALVEASPMPKLGNRYERFTPTNTVRRLKFVPGVLPSLPSERLLLAAFDSGDGDSMVDVERNGSRADVRVDDEGDETIRAPKGKQHPAHASSLFQSTVNGSTQPAAPREQSLEETIKVEKSHSDGPVKTSIAIDDDEDLDDSIEVSMHATQSEELSNPANKTVKAKKRKSFLTEADRPFKPTLEDEIDDDLEWDAAKDTKAKKKSRALAKTSRADGQVTTNDPSNASGNGAQPHNDLSSPFHSPSSSHGSIDSLAGGGHRLEPVYEEIEEDQVQRPVQHQSSVQVPIKDVPSRPTAQSTPARYGRNLATVTTAMMDKQSAGEGEHNAPRGQVPGNGNGTSRQSQSDADHPQGTPLSSVPHKQASEKRKKLSKAGKKKLLASQTSENRLQQQPDFQWPDDVF